jgi:hypothetical protein
MKAVELTRFQEDCWRNIPIALMTGVLSDIAGFVNHAVMGA